MLSGYLVDCGRGFPALWVSHLRTIDLAKADHSCLCWWGELELFPPPSSSWSSELSRSVPEGLRAAGAGGGEEEEEEGRRRRKRRRKRRRRRRRRRQVRADCRRTSPSPPSSSGLGLGLCDLCCWVRTKHTLSPDDYQIQRFFPLNVGGGTLWGMQQRRRDRAELCDGCCNIGTHTVISSV